MTNLPENNNRTPVPTYFYEAVEVTDNGSGSRGPINIGLVDHSDLGLFMVLEPLGIIMEVSEAAALFTAATPLIKMMFQKKVAEEKQATDSLQAVADEMKYRGAETIGDLVRMRAEEERTLRALDPNLEQGEE